MRSFSRDSSVTRQRLKPGTVRRVASYARPYRRELIVFMIATALDAVVTVAVPLLLGQIVNKIEAKDTRAVLVIAGAVAGFAVFDAFLSVAQRWYSARVGEGLIYDLRTEVFRHVQQQPIAFFTRAQTGSLVSRLNSDVIGAQQAITSTLSGVVSNVLSLILVLAAMFYLSWLVTVAALVLIPLFILPARALGRRMQRLTRESMQLDAAMGSTMTERFNVAGAMLVKLFGRQGEESEVFAGRAARVRDIGVVTAMYGRVFFIALVLLASMATALVYGLGGSLVIGGTISLGALVALASLLSRMYGPITALSNVQVDVMTALVSFDRVFEVLDLRPLIQDRPGATALPRTQAGAGTRSAPPGRAAPDIAFDHVSFRYPAASEVSLASLESIALPAPEHAGANQEVLRDVTFRAPPGQLTALVGPSGAGKTTITHLVSRLYDPGEGAVLIGGHDIRDVTQASLHDVIGVVTQDAHMFHDTIRANLAYARPGATDLGPDLRAARRAGHHRRGPGLPAVRRREAADRARQAAAQGTVRGGARRGDGAPRLRIGGRGAAGAEDRAGRADLAGDRAPAVHHPGCRPDPRHRRRPLGRIPPECRTCAAGSAPTGPSCAGDHVCAIAHAKIHGHILPYRGSAAMGLPP